MARIGRSRPVSNYRPLWTMGGRALVFDAALATTAILIATAVRGVDGDTALTATATLTATGQRSANVAAATAITATLTADAVVGPLIQAPTTVTATLTAGALATKNITTATVVTVSATATVTGATHIGAAIDVVAAVTAACELSRPAAASTAVTATLTAAMGTYVAANNTAVTAARTASVVRTAAGVKTADTSLPVTASLTATAVRGVRTEATTSVTAALPATISSSAKLTAQTLSVTVGLQAIAHIAGAPEPVTPVERIQRIPAENRTLTIHTEDRTQQIPSEQRVIYAHRHELDMVLGSHIVWPVPESRRQFNDSFGRPALGPTWLVGAHAPIIVSGQIRAGATGGNGVTTYYPMLFATSAGTNDQEATTVLVTAGTNPNASLGGGPIVRGNTSFDRVEMIATTTTAAIVTVIGGVRTIRAIESVSVPNFATLRLAATGSTYRAFVGGAATIPAATWVDSGHLITIDPTTRLIGQVVSSAKDGGGTASYGWELDDWVGRDV